MRLTERARGQIWHTVVVAFATGWFTMITGLALFFASAAKRAPLSRAARPRAFELLPVRYVPLCIAGLLAAAMSIH